MKKYNAFLIMLMAALAFLLLPMAGYAQETVRLHGSTTVQKRVAEPGKIPLFEATGIKLVIVGNGTGLGLDDLLSGKCDASMASEELADAVASMKAASGREAPADLMPHVITSDIIKVIVHPSNPVTKLSKDQLKGLHTGKIANWKEVGGPDLPVIVITSHIGSATRKVFQKSIMDNAPYVAGATEVKTTREEIEYVGQFPGAIGAVSQGFINLPEYKGKVKIVDSQEISRPLMLITKGAPSPAVKKVIDFFKGEGKKFIKD